MSIQFPVRPEEFEKGFVEQVFKAPSGSLQYLTHEPVGTGQVCDSYRFTCDWKNQEGPATFIAKCPSADAKSRAAAAMFHLYDMEVGWYRDLATSSGVHCPTPFHAAIAENKTDFVLLLSDMAPAIQGDQLAGGSLTQVRAAIKQAAKLHAFQPETALQNISWLGHGEGNGNLLRGALPSLFEQFRPRFEHRLGPAIMDMGSELMARIPAYMDYQPAFECIAHADMRLDNILFDQDGALACLVDWQTVQIGTGAGDIAYLIGTSFADPAERAREEKNLLHYYVDELASHGRSLDFDALWQDYRHYAFAGLIMAINASIYVEQTERGDEMFAVMAERPAQMALDLDSLNLL
ncbi:aminoglycoside phosphotransferase family protein [Parasphingorhabdus sp.]|uniref:phosphotransferase family protein n=1 Tax=Parasphingorhabdus sp. TaxID=2709688 RepID=UPI0032676530